MQPLTTCTHMLSHTLCTWFARCAKSALHTRASLSSPLPEDDRIIFAVPKKGRLATSVLDIVNGAGLQHVRPNRVDVAECTEVPVTLVFLPASDISRFVAEGNVDMGITGLDIIQENQSDVDIVEQLDMGKCRLAVQAPVGAYTDILQLAGKRIATSFPTLTADFFNKALDVATHPENKVEIKYLSGSVEAACALGLADAIVDLVETGTTMKAAGLEIVGKVMDTETVLIQNKHTTHAPLVKRIHKRILGFLKSKSNSMLTYNIPRQKLEEAKHISPGGRSPTISPLDDPTWCSVTALVPTKLLANVMDQLEDIGARDLIVFKMENCRINS